MPINKSFLESMKTEVQLPHEGGFYWVRIRMLGNNELWTIGEFCPAASEPSWWIVIGLNGNPTHKQLTDIGILLEVGKRIPSQDGMDYRDA